MKSNQLFNIAVYGLYGSILGVVIGVASWAFLFIVDEISHVLWDTIPNFLSIDSALYVFFLCVLGGVLVGCCQKRFGGYPHEIGEVLTEYKTDKRVDYKNLHKGVISGLTVLVFGASLGPEATLVGIIGGLCTWAADRLWVKRARKTLPKEANILKRGVHCTYSSLHSLLLAKGGEGDVIIGIPKHARYAVYAITGVVGYWVFAKLFDFVHLSPFVIKYGEAQIMRNEWIAVIPLILIGILVGHFFRIIAKFIKFTVKPLEKYTLAKAIVGGVVLGLFGIALPLVLFSGEHQLHDLIAGWSTMPAYLLLITGVSKLFITQFCLKTGWRGGQIYPLIFSGSCIGFAMASWFTIDPIMSAALVVSALVCTVVKKRIVIVLILLAFFPINLWAFIALAGFMAGLPERFKRKTQPAEQSFEA